MTVDELTQEQMQAYIHKAERVRKALEGAVEALKKAAAESANCFEFSVDVEEEIEQAIAAAEEALK